ncbi:GNAT family N-acetyltransferase [Gloeocapsa sp. BRSZ]
MLANSLDLQLTFTPCNPQVHGAFIRSLTRENFYLVISRTIGWDEELHQQEPHPEMYTMVYSNCKLIGFFSIREASDYLYIHTIQLVASFRGQGYGTTLLQHIENIARTKNLQRIQLSVFKENPAQRLYQRLGYKPIAEDEYLIRMEKLLEVN